MSSAQARLGTVATLAVILGGKAFAQAAPSFSGVFETYFSDNGSHRGAYDQLSWGELDVRISPLWKVTGSLENHGGDTHADEVYVRYEPGPASIQVGRFRTEFGFSSWSELYYNGFNHFPLVRSIPLAGDLSLTRDDAGVQATVPVGPVQIQAAAIETSLGSQQIVPDSIDHGAVRAQFAIERLIVGLDYLSEFNGDQSVYGIDARYTFPHWKIRAEAFKGVGSSSEAAEEYGGRAAPFDSGASVSNSGYYVDASYRVPSLTRTELVARTEQVFLEDATVTLETLGVRQIFCRYFSLNLNYGWGQNLDSISTLSPGVSGWSARAMFQVQF